MTARVGLAGFAVVLMALPVVLSEYHVVVLCYIGIYVLVALGLVVLTGIGNLTSFGQAAFVGIGAYTTAYLTTAQSMSPWIGLAAGLVLAGAVALGLGALTLRLSGYFLPLGTIAWGVSLYHILANLEFLGGFNGLRAIPPLSLFGAPIERGVEFFYLIWLVVLAALLLTRNLLDSRTGRAIRALKGGRIMAESMGVDTGRLRISIFVLAALFACLSGWLYAHFQRFVNPTPFGLGAGIEYLFMAIIGGAGHLWGAVVGAVVVTGFKEWMRDLMPTLVGQAGTFEMIGFSLLMILILHRAPEGIWSLVPAAMRMRTPPRIVAQLNPPFRRAPPPAGTPIVEVENVTKRFGGLTANDAVNLTVRAGEILAVIGPNGAGKSTLFNIISGLTAPSVGEIRVLGRSVVGLGARKIARLGVSRTFQHVRLLPQMTVLENVAIGAHLRGRRGLLSSMLRLERKEEAHLLAVAAHAAARVGLAPHLHERAGSLPLGQQRLVEIARALCADPIVLLLDEPAAGLRFQEKQQLASLLGKLRSEGIAILLVEHDMDFVMGLADRVAVMDFGQKIAEGSPAEVQRDPAVLEAYLGVAA